MIAEELKLHLNWIEEFPMKALVVTCINYQIILDLIPASRAKKCLGGADIEVSVKDEIAMLEKMSSAFRHLWLKNLKSHIAQYPEII